jgi:hypothetical protein
MFDTFDRTGDCEFPFPKQVVFQAICRGRWASRDENYEPR